MTDDISQAPDEREAIVRLIHERMEIVSKRPKPSDWPKDAWNARQEGIINHLALLAVTISRGDHLSEQGEGYE